MPPFRSPRLLSVLLTAAVVLPATAQTAPAGRPPVDAQPQGIVHLSASASAEVPRDRISLTLSTTRDGTDAAAVQSGLKQALDAALAEARRAATPGQVDVRTGGFSLTPRYGPKGAITGWQGTTELTLEGRDIAAISQLAGRITTLTVARVGFGLSREAREKAESELTARAIAGFRARADEVARWFGYAGYTVREVHVGSNEPAPIVPVMRARVAAAPPMADEALPVEPGQGTVAVTVSGSVQMTR